MVKEINLTLPELLGKSETVTSPGASVQLPHNATSASVALVIDGKCVQTGTPSPDAPAPINAIEELSLRVSGKNLLVPGIEQGSIGPTGNDEGVNQAIRIRSTEYVMLENGVTYTLSASGMQVYTRSESGWGSTGWLDTYTFTPTTTERFRFMFRRSDNSNVTPDMCKAQLELGSTATAYEPYTGYTEVPLPLNGEFIGSLPDGTHDELSVDAAGNVVLTKRVGRLDLIGSEVWSFENASQGAWSTPRQTIPAATPLGKMLSTFAPSDNINTGNNYLNVITPMTLAEWQAAMSGKQHTIYYPLAEPYTVHLDYSLPPVEGGEEMSVDTSLPTEIVWRYERMLWLPFEEIALVLDE